LDGWFYESGGGTCWMLAWQIDDQPWQIVPDEAFIANGESWTTTTVQTTTTTSVPETTVVDTSIAPVQTSIYTSSSTTTTMTSVTVEPSTTTTEYEAPPVQQGPVWVPPVPTIEPTIEDTEPSPVILEPVEETIPLEPLETLEPVETLEPLDPLDLLDILETDTTVETLDTLPFVVDSLPQLLPDEVVTEDTVADIFSDEELEAVLEDVETITVEEAVAVAQDAQFVESLSSEQAVAVFDAIVVSELSTQEIEAIVEAVQDAPAEVRQAFEQEINIFAEGFDEYVPLGSTVPVGTRRTLIAVAAGTAIVAAGQRRQL
jgi:hypothetical protein